MNISYNSHDATQHVLCGHQVGNDIDECMTTGSTSQSSNDYMGWHLHCAAAYIFTCLYVTMSTLKLPLSCGDRSFNREHSSHLQKQTQVKRIQVDWMGYRKQVMETHISDPFQVCSSPAYSIEKSSFLEHDCPNRKATNAETMLASKSWTYATF